MDRIEEIIRIFDIELIERKQGYLSLGLANQILVRESLMSLLEKNDNYLKKLLESGKIPHAYKTEVAPKQWRIPLSAEGAKKFEEIHGKSLINPKKLKSVCPECGTYTEMGKHCSGCGSYLVMPKEIIPEKYYKKPIKNPLKEYAYQANQRNQRNHKKAKTPNTWLLAVLVVVVLYFIGTFLGNETTSDSSVYYIKTATYATRSKESYDEMFQYISNNDKQALVSLKLNGEIEVLDSGTEVFLIKSRGTYCVVRQQGSREQLWMVSNNLTKK